MGGANRTEILLGGARCEVRGARCEVRGARCEVRGACMSGIKIFRRKFASALKNGPYAVKLEEETLQSFNLFNITKDDDLLAAAEFLLPAIEKVISQDPNHGILLQRLVFFLTWCRKAKHQRKICKCAFRCKRIWKYQFLSYYRNKFF
jgi:hypothetical protein